MDLDALAARIREHGTAGPAVRPGRRRHEACLGRRPTPTTRSTSRRARSTRSSSTTSATSRRCSTRACGWPTRRRVRRRGPDAGARPAAGRGRRRDDRRDDRHGRLRPAAPPLRRRARPGRRHHRRALRRHGRQVRRQGHQERRRLRPREAVRRLVRDARADRAVAVRLHPLPASTATALGASDDPERLAEAAAALARTRWRPTALDVALGRATAATCSCASAAPPPSQQAERDRRADARARPRRRARRGRRRASSGTASARRSAPPTAIVLKVSGPPDRPAGRDRRRPRPGGTVVSRAALGLSWLALPAGADVAAVREALHPRPVRGARRRREGRRRVARAARGHARRDGPGQGALRPRADLPPGRVRGRHLTWRSPGTSTSRPSWT